MPDIVPVLIIGLLQVGIGGYVMLRKRFSVRYRARWFFIITWGDRESTFTLTGFRAISFGIVNIVAGIIVVVPLLAMQLLKINAIQPTWLLVASMLISVISYVVECLVELLHNREVRRHKRKNEEKTRGSRLFLGDDGELIEPATTESNLNANFRHR